MIRHTNKKRPLDEIAKSLGFEYASEVYNYLLDSHLNGQFSQVKSLLYEMEAFGLVCLLQYLDELPADAAAKYVREQAYAHLATIDKQKKSAYHGSI